MAVIYRKYRPQKFDEVSGQENIIKILKGSMKRNKIGHAFLFSGPRGVGKTTIARILSKAINCEKLSKDFEPCGKCSACVEINENKSLDFTEIDAASNRGIDEIRQLREAVNFSPSKNKYRVYILDEAHMLTKEAFNALLKTLEEPPEHAVFILATTEANKIPATVASRCQRFDFSRLTADEIIKRIDFLAKKEGILTEKSAVEAIAKNCEGCIRDAESVFEQVASLNNKKVLLSDIEEMLGVPDVALIRGFAKEIIEKDTMAAIQTVDKILCAGKDLFIVTASLISYLRNILIIKIDDSLEEIALKEYSSDEVAFMKELAQKISANDLISAIKILTEAHEKMKYSDFPQVCLEIAVAEITLKNIDSNQCLPNSKKDVMTKDSNEDNAEKEALLKSEIASEGEKDILKLAQEQWSEILSQVKTKNQSVYAFLKTCSPACILKNNLHVATNYQFYKERLNVTQSRIVIEKALNDVLRNNLGFRCMMEKELKEMGVEVLEVRVQKQEAREKGGEDLLSEALKMFGGQETAEETA